MKEINKNLKEVTREELEEYLKRLIFSHRWDEEYSIYMEDVYTPSPWFILSRDLSECDPDWFFQIRTINSARDILWCGNTFVGPDERVILDDYKELTRILWNYIKEIYQ